MPVKSKAQLRKAGVEAAKGKSWAKEMIEHTPKGAAKKLPERVKHKRGKKA